MAVKKEDLKPFQVDAINRLSEQFLDLWKTNKQRLKLIFKAPTGSGKTIMMAEFIRSLDTTYNFHDDKCYIWISFGDDTSYKQSKNKFIDYYYGESGFSFKDKNDLNDGKLLKNNILFINWSSIKANDKSGRILRREDENSEGDLGMFDSFIVNTKEEREIILIVDEAHTESTTNLADEIYDLLDPRIIIKVTATPTDQVSAQDIFKKRAGYVEVDEEDVIESGLIKEKIITQTSEDIENLRKKDDSLSIDQILLHLAVKKRKELEKIYCDNNIKVNPLVLIQLPNDYKETEEVSNNIKTMVLEELTKLGVNIDNEVAIWLDKEKTLDKLKNITNLNDDVNYLLFKVAPATGWDCPRASILVMYREIQSPIFRAQILGRIKRMPFGKRFIGLHELNRGYIFTNYTKDDIKDVTISTNPNSPTIYYSRLKDDISQLEFNGDVKLRTGYNTITPPTKWQKVLSHQADLFFNTDSNNDYITNLSLISNKIKTQNISITNLIVSDAEIDSFDNFIEELKERSSEKEIELSNYNIEKLYNLMCFDVLKKQEDNKAKYNVARSWRTIKSSLNSWFESRTGIDDCDIVYPIFVNDFLSSTSAFKQIIYHALIEFRTIVTNKTEYVIKNNSVKIPLYEDSFNEKYSQIDNINKCAFDKFYLLSEYDGRDNELNFIKYIDNLSSVLWWIKQCDSGSNAFGLRYIKSDILPPNDNQAIFNPDFIIRTKNRIYILDTKDGITLRSNETADKARDLQEWIRNHQSEYSLKIVGGIVKNCGNGIWKLNRNSNYNFKDESQWEILKIE